MSEQLSDRVAERNLLGAILLAPEVLDEVREIVTTKDFSASNHQVIFAAMQALSREGQRVDYHILEGHLKDKGQIELAGGVGYFVALPDEVPTHLNATTYANRVAECARRRRVQECLSSSLQDIQKGRPSAEVVRTAIETLSGCNGHHESNQLVVVTGDELLSQEFPPADWIVDPIFPAKSVNLLFAKRGVGKSKLIHGLAVAVATGSKFLRWNAPEPKRTLIIDGEMPAPLLQQWYGEAVYAIGAEPGDNLRILAHDMQPHGAPLPDIGTVDGQERLAPFLKDVDFLILDNLTTLCRTGVENEREGFLAVQIWLKLLAREGTASLVCHHAGKTNGQRGSSAHEDVMHTVIALQHPEAYVPQDGARFVIKYEKCRGLLGQDVEPVEAQLTTGENGRPIWVTRSPDSVTADIVECAKAGMATKEIMEHTGKSKSWICETIANARKRGEL